jgi:hypothetical protein
MIRILSLAGRFGVLLFGALPIAGRSAESSVRITSLESLRNARQQAADRTRRVIFNNDGNEPVYLCKTTSPEELLSYRTTPSRARTSMRSSTARGVPVSDSSRMARK